MDCDTSVKYQGTIWRCWGIPIFSCSFFFDICVRLPPSLYRLQHANDYEAVQIMNVPVTYNMKRKS